MSQLIEIASDILNRVKKMVNKAVIALSCYNEKFYPDGARTGSFVIESMHPFNTFRKAGYDVTFTSETGTYGFDEKSLIKDFLDGEDLKAFKDPNSDYNKHLKNIKKASDLKNEHFDIFLAAGGHGTLFDFPKATNLKELVANIYAKGGVVATLCHAPALFDNLKDKKTGRLLIEGKSITGFPDAGEYQLKVNSIMKDLGLSTVREFAEKLHAKYLGPIGAWDNFSITDGRIVTGVNPASAISTALRCIDAAKNK